MGDNQFMRETLKKLVYAVEQHEMAAKNPPSNKMISTPQTSKLNLRKTKAGDMGALGTGMLPNLTASPEKT
jgi:hypothetical protein